MKKNKNEKNKCLCKLSKKDIEQDFKYISSLILDPKYLCTKCARASNSKSFLCHPQII